MLKVVLKRPVHVFLFVFFAFSTMACQVLAPARTGTMISACSQIVSEINNLQPAQIPEHLLTTEKKRGDEFDANQYFDLLTHISMREGYALDYVYQHDTLGGYPLLYARPVEQAPYASAADIAQTAGLPEYQEYLEVEDTEQGYFEYVVMDIMANQFYLFWHANYNDTRIVCNRQQVYDIVEQISSGEFGYALDRAQQEEARLLRNIMPVVRLTGDVAVVEVVTFTKWGGFYRLTYSISREVPHTITDIQKETILPYDCGVMF